MISLAFSVLVWALFDRGRGVDLNLAVESSYPTPLSQNPLLPLLLLSLARQKNSPDTSRIFQQEYDYVIVGAGTAGSVLAARLSEVACVSVLLLEAGGPPPRLNDVPGIGSSFWFTNLDWQFVTTPQKYTGRGLVGRQLPWPAGRGLGGSTLLNNGIHVRGNRKDYDGWAAMGAEGWSYEDVLPYFKKLEDNVDLDVLNNGFHGVGGPVSVMRPRYEPEIKRVIHRAVKDLGYEFVDPNAYRQTSFYDIQVNMKDNQRWHMGKAYLVPAENRTNLDIVPHAFVKKIVIEQGRAVGVLFDHEGSQYEVRAKREVILSAGAVKTPHLLLLSGIGPRHQLQKFNIPVHADLPGVGQNLQDHAATAVDFLLRPHTQESNRITLRYIYNRSGPLASAEGVSYVAFLPDDSEIDFPNYELYFAETKSTSVSQQQLNMKPEVYRQVYGPYENQSMMLCITQQLHPRSRGSVTLQSANPYDPPLVDPNYLEDPRDVQDFVDGMKTCRSIGSSYHMREAGVRPFRTLYPGCESLAQDEDAYFTCQTRTMVATFSHYCGTAKMGHPDDPTSVVDPELRVKNIQGLRVVDNSIMPKIISGNTAVPAIMIGEKASDIIKESIVCDRCESGRGLEYQHGFQRDDLKPSKWYDNKPSDVPQLD